MFAGISPLKLLEDKIKNLNFLRFPILEGIDPSRAFPLKSITLKF
jgi:hypothetical protein